MFRFAISVFDFLRSSLFPMAGVQAGIRIDQDIIDTFYELQRNKSFDFIIYKISDDRTHVELDYTHPREAKFNYQSFLDKIIQYQICVYAILDYQYQSRDGSPMSKIFMINWNPEEAPIRSKMLFASTKGQLRDALEKTQKTLDVSGQEDLDEAEIGKALGL